MRRIVLKVYVRSSHQYIDDEEVKVTVVLRGNT